MSKENEKPDEMFYCSFVSIHYIICECGETFPSEDELRVHLEKMHPFKLERTEYKCGECDAIFETERACIQHHEEDHSELIEEYEVKQEYEGATLNEEIVAEVTLTEGTQADETVQHVELWDHANLVKVTKPKPKREKRPRSYYVSKNIVCEVCGKSYASNAALRYHQRVHTGERPFKCTMCPKAFTMPLFLQIHVRTHTGERPFKCPHCPKAFSNKAALLRHDRVHTGIKPYECPQCGKFFTQSNSMKLHFNTVHLKMPAPYKSKNRKIKEAKAKAMMITKNIKMEPNTESHNTLVINKNVKAETFKIRNLNEEYITVQSLASKNIKAEKFLIKNMDEQYIAVQSLAGKTVKAETVKIKNMDEDYIAVQSIGVSDVSGIEVKGIKTEDDYQEAEILYEDDNSQESIAYEVIYE